MTQYINKADIVAEINRVLDSYDPNQITSGRYALIDLRNFLETLEVKEVNLKKEINKYIKDNICGYLLPGVEETAKHFFELGLKAQKGGEE